LIVIIITNINIYFLNFLYKKIKKTGSYENLYCFCHGVMRVFEWLTYAKRTRFTDIKINVDSALVVQVVKTSNLKSLFGLTLVNNIRRLVDTEWKVYITLALIRNQTNVTMFWQILNVPYIRRLSTMRIVLRKLKIYY
jgi:hypothetical protein